METSGWHWVTADRNILRGKGLLSCIVINASTSGGTVTLYDGSDANAARLIGVFQALTNVTTPITFPKPLRLDRGLYVTLDQSVTGVLIAVEAVNEFPE